MMNGSTFVINMFYEKSTPLSFKKYYTVKLCKMQSNIGHTDDIAHWNFAITFEFIVHGILINTIGLIGLIGNIVAIGVLSRPQMKSSITTILIGLVR